MLYRYTPQRHQKSHPLSLYSSFKYSVNHFVNQLKYVSFIEANETKQLERKVVLRIQLSQRFVTDPPPPRPPPHLSPVRGKGRVFTVPEVFRRIFPNGRRYSEDLRQLHKVFLSCPDYKSHSKVPENDISISNLWEKGLTESVRVVTSDTSCNPSFFIKTFLTKSPILKIYVLLTLLSVILN